MYIIIAYKLLKSDNLFPRRKKKHQPKYSFHTSSVVKDIVPERIKKIIKWEWCGWYLNETAKDLSVQPFIKQSQI